VFERVEELEQVVTDSFAITSATDARWYEHTGFPGGD
jgi:hypothetical protein